MPSVSFRSRRHLATLLIVLVAGWLRTLPLTQNRFHPDEALYATFGRLIASGHDPLLSTVVVDKPPLPFYLMASSMAVFGGTELAARLPTFFASVLTVAVVYQLGRSLYGTTAGLLAALLMAASPMAILFAITVFTDTLLAAFLFLSLLCVVRGRWGAAGWAFGLAFACKQSALFFLPLVGVLAVMVIIHHGEHGGHTPANCARGQEGHGVLREIFVATRTFIVPVIICSVAIFVWDYSRHASISFWVQGYSDNSPGRLVRSNEIWPRWWAWLDLMQYLTGSWVVNVVLLVGLPLILMFGRRSLAALYDYSLPGFALTFLIGYWLLAFNVWDRYLVILTPIVALLGGRILERGVAGLRWLVSKLSRFKPKALSLTVFILTALCLTPSAVIAARSGYPIGGDHGAYEGIDQIAETLKQVPPGSVLYDHWLSWELGFYLFDGPAYIAWMPGPSTLTDDLKSFGKQSNRYIVSPEWESFTEMQTAIDAAGFETKVLAQTYRRDGSVAFTLYQIVPR